jgi:hypothetical protein
MLMMMMLLLSFVVVVPAISQFYQRTSIWCQGPRFFVCFAVTVAKPSRFYIISVVFVADSVILWQRPYVHFECVCCFFYGRNMLWLVNRILT